MRTTLLSLAAGVAAIACATQANAAASMFPVGDNYFGFIGVASGTQANPFSYDWTFSLADDAIASVGVEASNVSTLPGITFTSLLLNGVALNSAPVLPNQYFSLTDIFVSGGTHTLTLTGYGSGVYTGSVAFDLLDSGGNPAAVPEPMSWALMLGGFGAVGSMLRTSKRQKASVTFA